MQTTLMPIRISPRVCPLFEGLPELFGSGKMIEIAADVARHAITYGNRVRPTQTGFEIGVGPSSRAV